MAYSCFSDYFYYFKLKVEKIVQETSVYPLSRFTKYLHFVPIALFSAFVCLNLEALCCFPKDKILL